MVTLFHYNVTGLKKYKTDLKTSIRNYSEIIDFSGLEISPADIVCGDEVIQDFYTDEPKITLHPGFKTFWIASDPASIYAVGKSTRVPTQFLLLGNADTSLKSYTMSYEEPRHAQLHGCMYRGKIPEALLLDANAHLLLENRVYVAKTDFVGGGTIERIK